MSVLTLAGKPIDWTNPPAPTTKVMWSQRTTGGKPVIGSLRTIAFIDHLSILAMKRFGTGIRVIQPPFNTGVKASANTHDYDACFDWDIPNVPPAEQQRFARANGMADWSRVPPAFTPHQHGFPLPPMEGSSRADDFRSGGFVVGLYVDGGISLHGRQIASSQLVDHYEHRTGLSGHAYDPSWFPSPQPIFDLNAYIRRQREAQVKMNAGPDQIVNLSSHGPLARLGGEAGQELWDEWEAHVRKESNLSVRDGLTVIVNSDTNKRDGLPNFGGAFKGIANKTRRIGGKTIDLIGVRRAVGGASVKVIKRKTVNLHIDGHDGFGVKIKVRFPSGRTVIYWDVQANLGRGVSEEVFRGECKRLYRAFGKNAVYNFNEIDEADVPREHPVLREVFTPEFFQSVGWNTMCPTLVGRRKLRVVEGKVTVASPGMAKVSPMRVLVKTVLAPK